MEGAFFMFMLVTAVACLADDYVKSMSDQEKRE